MCSTACHTVSTYKDYHKAKKNNDFDALKAIKWRVGFIANTIVGEILMMISSKGHGEGVKSDISTEDSMIAVTAEIISQQKPELQAPLIEEMAKFLGRKDVLGEKDLDVGERLKQAVDAMNCNPWAKVACDPTRMSAPKSRPLVGNNPVWQQKTLASQTVSPSLSA